MKHTLLTLAFLLLARLAGVCLGAPNPLAVQALGKVPLIDVTDLYHPHQDVGDNFDILAA